MAPLPLFKFVSGGGQGFACFVGGRGEMSDPATGGTLARFAGHRRLGPPVGHDHGPPIVCPAAKLPGFATPAGRPLTNVGG
jgi:hypothetical protein